MSAYPYGIRARANETLSIDQMRAYVPSLFAERPHESRSDRYVFIPSVSIMESLMAEGFLPVEARQGRTRDESRRGFTKHMVRFRKQGDVARARKVGDVSFEVMLRTGHDGTASWDFMAALMRLVCLNGMCVDDGTIASVHVYHRGNRQQILDKVIEGAYEVVSQAPIVIDAVDNWAGIELNRDERLALAESARVVRFGDSEGKVETPIQASQLLIPRRPADQGNDLWRTFNVLQENTVRGGISAMGHDAHGRPHRTTTREVRGIDQDVKLNKALWLLAESMAKLKQAA
jgi:hypothetical protein